MKRIQFPLLVFAVFATTAFYSCKGKTKDTENSSTVIAVDTPATAAPAPVQISGDDVLKQGVTDAVKDYPNVKAEVSDGVINLSGEIKRADWQKLNPTLNSLHPKRVNSDNLTIK